MSNENVKEKNNTDNAKKLVSNTITNVDQIRGSKF